MSHLYLRYSSGLFAGFWFLFVGCGQLHASDYKNWRSPLYENVDRVFVYVKYNGARADEEQAALPEGIRKKNIERILFELFRKRFSSTECHEVLRGRNPYSCDDQPVTLLTGEQYRGHENREARKQLGTLTVRLEVRVNKTPEGIYSEDSPAAMYLIRERPDPDISIDLKLSGPIIISKTPSVYTFEERVKKYISGRIM